MCRHAVDLAPMLKILSSAGDRNTIERLQLDTAVDISKIKFYFMSDDGGFPLITAVHPELRRAQQSLLKMFQDNYNVTVKEAKLPNLFHSLPIWTNSMASDPEMKAFAAEMVQVR